MYSNIVCIEIELHTHTSLIFSLTKGCECRFYFPFRSCAKTCIQEDRGVNDEHVIDWHRLDGNIIKLAPWLLEPKRPMGCQFINPHSNALSKVLNCNTNVQIGDASQVYYSTLYTGKNNQKEDRERQERITVRVGKIFLNRGSIPISEITVWVAPYFCCIAEHPFLGSGTRHICRRRGANHR